MTMCQYRREIADSGCGSRKNNLALNLVWTKELLADFMKGILWGHVPGDFQQLQVPGHAHLYVFSMLPNTLLNV